MRQATVGHLMRGPDDRSEVLLGKRQSLFYNGRWIGPGGKFKRGEKAPACLCRELGEEVDVEIDPASVSYFARVDAYHPNGSGHKLKWRVHFFRVARWQGEPRPLDGFSELGWFPYKNLPYLEMMPDERIWMPTCLAGTAKDKLLIAEVFYKDRELTTVERCVISFADLESKPTA